MTCDDGSSIDDLARDSARRLQRVLDEIDAGRLDADDVQRAYVAGAVNALRQLTDRAASDRRSVEETQR